MQSLGRLQACTLCSSGARVVSRRAFTQQAGGNGSPLPWYAAATAAGLAVAATVTYAEASKAPRIYTRDEPGVFLWGNNRNGVVDFESATPDTIVKYPTRVRFFDGKPLQCLAVTSDCGAAVDQDGDVYQWGAGFWGTQAAGEPAKVLSGKSARQVYLTSSHLVVLTKSGGLYVAPLSRKARNEQMELVNPGSSTATPSSPSLLTRLIGWGSNGPEPGFVLLQLPTESGKDKIVDCKVSDSHLLALTDKQNVFATPLTTTGNENGQLAQAPSGLRSDPLYADGKLAASVRLTPVSFFNDPARKQSRPVEIAVGQSHSLARTEDGRLYIWGGNSNGQLGLGESNGRANVHIPTEISPVQFFQGRRSTSTSDFSVQRISAAGSVSAAVVERRVQDYENNSVARSVSELYVWGHGQTGALGNGKCSNFQATPTLVHTLSGLQHYSDRANAMIPIRVLSLAMSPTHALATLATSLEEPSVSTSEELCRFGNDVYAWGAGSDGQLGTGKRSQLATPVCPGAAPWRTGSVPAADTAPQTSDESAEQLQHRDINGDGIDRLQALRRRLWQDKAGRRKQHYVQDEIVAGPGVSGLYTKCCS
ncbi:hypothetical protein RI367_003799 [Sorochytrium milnesiophthora]